MYSVYAHPSVTKVKVAAEAMDKPQKGDSVSKQLVISLRRLADELVNYGNARIDKALGAKELIEVVTDDE
jgi:hypothetical protein